MTGPRPPASFFANFWPPFLQNGTSTSHCTDEESPNRYLENTERLWREVYGMTIDVRADVIAPALLRRRQGYGEPPRDSKKELGS